MKNLEQIRAFNALSHRGKEVGGKDGGEVVKKVPTMIMENGILGALAFALEDSKNGHEKIFEIVLEHLKTPEIGMNIQADSVSAFAEELAKSDSANLRAVTHETMKYLSYLRRFVKKDKEA